MSGEAAPSRRYYWQRLVDPEGHWAKEYKEGPPGADLAALRRGLGRESGDVPAMWRYYTELRADGRRHRRLEAEHATLALFALHQQSKRNPMHHEGVGVGSALQVLRRDERSSADAVDRRFAAAATAGSFTEVVAHLRGLITQLRGIDQSLDYTRLLHDLTDWQYPERISAVRRRWGAQYFTASQKKNSDEPDLPAPRSPAEAPTSTTPTVQELI